jgi:starch phosphorylase
VKALQPSYDPAEYIARSPALAEVLELMASGFFSYGDADRFKPVVDQLRLHDPYMVCADFEPYVATENRAAAAYRDRLEWSRRALHNIIGARKFSSDSTIRQYAQEIWGVNPVKIDFGLITS